MSNPLSDLLVVCDIDNTLITEEMELPACNLEMIRLFCTLGGRFTVATGRTPASARRAVQGVPINAPAITCGGALVCDLASGQALASSRLESAPARWVMQEILRQFPEVGAEVMVDEGCIYVVNASEYTEKHLRDEGLGCLFSPLEEVPDGWLKALFAAPPALLQRVAQCAESLSCRGVQFVSTNRIYFEIMPEKVNKGTALRQICQKMQIPLANTVAIGDYYNDIELMKMAGHAVAMGNAPAEVKMIAEQITGDCRDGGVASYLYQLIKQYT